MRATPGPPPISSSRLSLQTFTERCHLLAELINLKKYDLLRLLTPYETHTTVYDEVERAVHTLRGVEQEFARIQHPLRDLSIVTFFPLNLPLYSLVLFGIVPSFFAQHVFIRPPEVMRQTLHDLCEWLELSRHFPHISVQALPRHTFMELYSKEADVIIFTGKYENALTIQRQCAQALLVYNGSGINPFVILNNANLEHTVTKAVEMRCFNSGQDCAGPDAFFVPRDMADEFVKRLRIALAQVRVGDSTDPTVEVSKTIKSSYIEQLQTVLQRERGNIIYGGTVDAVNHLVHPTIIRKPLAHHQGAFHEFFAPVFYVLAYEDQAELERTLLSENFREHTMYISIFGHSPALERKLTFAKVLRNQIVNDVERGNQEYGGYGSKANFLLYGTNKTVKPVLISRDIHLVLA